MRALVILLSLSFLTSCDRTCENRGKHSTVTYVNNSPRRIVYFVVNNYPDTTWLENSGTPVWRELKAYSSNIEVSEKSKCVEARFRGGKTYWVCFSDRDSLIKRQQNDPGYFSAYTAPGVLLERRAVDLPYLENHGFTITYTE